MQEFLLPKSLTLINIRIFLINVTSFLLLHLNFPIKSLSEPFLHQRVAGYGSNPPLPPFAKVGQEKEGERKKSFIFSIYVRDFSLSHLHRLGYGIYRQVIMIDLLNPLGSVQTPLPSTSSG
jgi:hypothetical protein